MPVLRHWLLFRHSVDQNPPRQLYGPLLQGIEATVVIELSVSPMKSREALREGEEARDYYPNWKDRAVGYIENDHLKDFEAGSNLERRRAGVLSVSLRRARRTQC